MKTIANRPEKRTGPCIWMQAEVVDRKFCKHGYECIDCRFDRIMHRTAGENMRIRQAGGKVRGKRARIVFWKDNLRKLSPWRRPCLHHMKGRIGFRACHNSYHCHNCDFDQYFQDQYAVHAVVKPVDILDIQGFKVPHGYYLHRGHAWAKIEENSTVRVGIDDFAVRLFGPFDRVVSPLMGEKVTRGEPGIVLERSGREAKMLSPVSGVVTEINAELREKVDIGGPDIYAKGWVMRVRSDNLRADLRELMIGGETAGALEKEVDTLYEMIEETAGPLTVDGGVLSDDIYGKLPGLGWDRLTRTFLR